MTSRAARRLALVALAIGVSGCGGDGDTGVEYPPTHGVFDYQLGGTYGRISTPDGESRIDIVVRDSTEEPLVGAYNVYYINGFQTQPGDEAVWLGERADALLLDSAGRPVIDPDWPDEYVLDPSTREQREVILGAVVPLVDACREAGYDAVEIDNLDTWTRFARIDRDGAIALAREYVDAAHQRGLAIAQKNAAEFLGVENEFRCGVVQERQERIWMEHVVRGGVLVPDKIGDVAREEDPRPAGYRCGVHMGVEWIFALVALVHGEALDTSHLEGRLE